MPSSKKTKNNSEKDKKQTSLFTFSKEADSKKNIQETKKEKPKTQKVKQTNKSKAIIKEKKQPEKSIKIKEKTETPGEIPIDLYYKENKIPFGLEDYEIKPIRGKRESNTSKYIRYLKETGRIVENLNKGLLLDIDYDGGQNKAYCKFYDLETDEIRIWLDTTKHEPYCLSKEKLETLKVLSYNEKIGKKEVEKRFTDYGGFNRFEQVSRIDLLSDKKIDLVKIYGYSPTNIGGSGTNIRNILAENGFKAWEADIRYHLNYIFDRQLIPGLIYSIKDGNIEKIQYEETSEELKTLANELRELFKEEKPEIKEFSEKFLDIFLTPIPDVKRLAFDIEVNLGEKDYRIPDPRLAEQEVISVSFVASDGFKAVYMLERNAYDYKEPFKKFPEDARIIYFKSEKKLLEETFRLLWEYPVVLSFNGDNFDLNYLFHRANKLRVKKELNPIQVKRGFGILSKAECDLRKGIHVDLFNFFFNRSISGYAFSGAYQSASLNAISEVLLGREKYQHEEEIHEMEYDVLSWYNLKDSLLTLELTKFNNSLVWNLIIILCRMTKLPIHEMVRRQISTWIQNIFYFEHRRKNYLIPRRSEISEVKKGGFGQSVINGKGFQGAYVVDPVPGIHFDVVVMDFASLYPSIIKEKNLSYETILCPHEDCQDNLVMGTPYHICTHKMGIFSYVVGFFRDIRVKYFKPKSGDKNLSERQRSYYNTIQQALKVFINGSYGVFGSVNFPLFCLPVAESTTAIGRSSIGRTIQKSEEMGVKVLYGDSIIGSRCVVIKKDNYINVVPIEEFWREIRQPVHNIYGKEVKIPQSTFTLSKNGEWQKIKQIIRYETNKNVYRINQKNGETICTEDHSIITEDMEPVRPTDLGDRKIEFLKTVPHETSCYNEIIDLFQLVRHFSFNTCYKGKIKLNKWQADDSFIWFGWANIQNQKKIKRFCHIADLCKILGIYIADGHSSFHKGKTGYKAVCGISSSNQKFLEDIKEIMLRIDYNHQISIIRTSKSIRTVQGYIYEDTTHSIQTNSVTWTAFFASLCGAGSENKHLPSFIFNIEKKYQQLLYNFYLFGDGSRNQNKNSFTTKSLRLVSGLCYLLKSWNINISIYFQDKGNVYRIREREGFSDFKHPIKTRLRKLPLKKRYVYDLSVENSEIFVDACGMILLHNTDSVFLLNPTKNQMKDLSEWSKENLDLDLEEEKTYQFLALSDRKKNYVGIYKDTKYVDIKGLVAKKKNTPEFIKTIFSELLDILKTINNEKEFIEAKEKIISLVRENMKKIGKPNAFSLRDYAINISMQKKINKYDKVTPQHVSAAKELIDIELAEAKSRGASKEELDSIRNQYRKGDVIEFIKSKSSIGAKVLKIAKLQDLDTKKYKSLLKSALEQVFDALGISFDDVKGIKKMDAFF